MLGAGIVFCAYLYGPEAGIGLGIICTIPIVRIIRGWAHLESFDHKSFSIARELESRHTEPTVAAPHDGARPARVQRGQTVVGQSKLLDAMSERKRPNGKARAGTLLQGATSYRSRVISPVEAPEGLGRRLRRRLQRRQARRVLQTTLGRRAHPTGAAARISRQAHQHPVEHGRIGRRPIAFRGRWTGRSPYCHEHDVRATLVHSPL